MKPFSFSWSKIKNYRTCPKRHYEIDIAKNYKEEGDNPALKWGNEVHEAMAKFIGKGVKLPTLVDRYEAWPTNVRKLAAMPGVDCLVEQKLAIGKDFKAASFFSNDAWFRAVADVLLLIKESKAAITIDWKTGGKVQPEFEQLALSSQTVFATYPWVEEVLAIYVWFGHDTQSPKIYRKADMPAVWNELWPVITEMTDAAKTTTYPAKPSGLCKNYCKVTNCPYHGKGSPR